VPRLRFDAVVSANIEIHRIRSLSCGLPHLWQTSRQSGFAGTNEQVISAFYRPASRARHNGRDARGIHAAELEEFLKMWKTKKKMKIVEDRRVEEKTLKKED